LRYRAILFDVGGTLIGPRESYGTVYGRVLQGMGVERPAAVLERALRAAWETMNARVPRGADRYGWFPGGERGYWRRFVRQTLEEAGARLEDPLADRLLESLREAFLSPSSWQVYPEVAPVLEQLRREGIRLGVVSNWDSRLPALLDRLGLARHFDAILVSHLEGIEKPDPELFRRAVARLRTRAEDALHVGDTPELDLVGARAAGLEAALVDRAGSADPSLGALRDLSPLPELARRGLPRAASLGGGGSRPAP